ncbi:FixH family protein [Thermoflavimicrobium daqui]|uniref:YtkA-like domain-containing protein n=1 Tax=Thermoflavimicrobium daqui TaxID=2137476 RepID=A0A364K300_9BACL|nr:FixH family protein [Thermoflavimicrobium daqui]RAL23210.1 hypothetical protein DL897_12660 [Thermoflavimicrobium daqui]
MYQLTRKFLLITLILIILAITACQQQANLTSDHQKHNQTSHTSKQGAQQLAIQFKANPSKVDVGKSIQLSSTVKRGDKPATDATVKFEVWEKNSKEKHQMLDAKHDGKGTYHVNQTYSKAGEYLVVVHVTAPQVHQMISGQFQVGNLKHSHHHGHGQAVQLHMMLPDSIQKGKEVTLVGHVQQVTSIKNEQQNYKPLEKANVRFEIWQEGKDQHQFVDTKESSPGQYTATYTFLEASKYHIKLHVEKDKIHEHKEETKTVQ